MEKRTAIITGPTRGIGRGLFDRLGCSVAGTYHRDDQAAAELQEPARAAGTELLLSRSGCRLERFENHQTARTARWDRTQRSPSPPCETRPRGRPDDCPTSP